MFNNIDLNFLKRIQTTLYDLCGINLDTSKKTMIQNRINILMKDPVLANVHDLNTLLDSLKNNAQIRQAFINGFTTNKTDLFRESYHFDDMIDRSLAILFKKNLPVKILCSASSSGEEPYSIATTCLYAKQLYNSKSIIRIIATDIDTQMLSIAQKGEYNLDLNLVNIPHWVKLDEYFNVTKQKENHILMLQAKPAIRNLIRFQKLNLFDKSYGFASNEFDIIFCRNVLIYFKISDQEQILGRLFNALKINGTLYLGHSEDAIGLKDKVERLGNKIFYKL